MTVWDKVRIVRDLNMIIACGRMKIRIYLSCGEVLLNDLSIGIDMG